MPQTTKTPEQTADETNNLVLEAFLNLGLTLDRIIAEHGPYARHHLDDSDHRLQPCRASVPHALRGRTVLAHAAPFMQHLSDLVQQGHEAPPALADEVPLALTDDDCVDEPRLLAANIVFQAQAISQRAHELVNSLDSLKDGLRHAAGQTQVLGAAAICPASAGLHEAIEQLHAQTVYLEELVRQFASGRRAALTVIEGARRLPWQAPESNGGS